MVLPDWLLGALAAPDHHGPLQLVGGPDSPDGAPEELYDPTGRRAYPVEGGIPVLLLDRARPVDDAEHARLTTDPPEATR